MIMYDDVILDYFLENQRQLFPENVAETREEAEYFLEDCMAQVVESKAELIEYFGDVGFDFDEANIEEASEVFVIGDGRYLIVEG